jgi:multidrug efflux pump
MGDLEERLSDIVRRDPAVASITANVGVDGQNGAVAQGRMTINLKPREDRDPQDVVIARLRNAARQIAGIRFFSSRSRI